LEKKGEFWGGGLGRESRVKWEVTLVINSLEGETSQIEDNFVKGRREGGLRKREKATRGGRGTGRNVESAHSLFQIKETEKEGKKRTIRG